MHLSSSGFLPLEVPLVTLVCSLPYLHIAGFDSIACMRNHRNFLSEMGRSMKFYEFPCRICPPPFPYPIPPHDSSPASLSIPPFRVTLWLGCLSSRLGPSSSRAVLFLSFPLFPHCSFSPIRSSSPSFSVFFHPPSDPLVTRFSALFQMPPLCYILFLCLSLSLSSLSPRHDATAIG